MTNKPRHPHRKPLWQKFAKFSRPWHRRLGIFSALLVIMVSLSGIMINHSHSLGLGSRHVKQAWLLDHYGIKAPAQIKVFQLSPLLASSDNLLWLNDRSILEAEGPILAAISYADQYVAIDQQNLYLLSQQGVMLERQSRVTGLPSDLISLAWQSASAQPQLWLNTQSGSYLADADLIDWQQAMPLVAPQWQAPLHSAQANLAQQAISLNARASHLSWERVLLDLHSGRILGLSGTLLMDLVAVSLIFMAISGFYLWQQNKPRKRPKKVREHQV